jgi:GNAT superfamily N-acetyltransferase
LIRTATREDLPALRKLLADANDAPYDLAAVADEKCFGAGIAGAPTVRVFEHGETQVGVSVTCGKYLRILAVARSFRGRGIGTALLEDSAATVIAAEPGNYFTPGVLTTDEASMAFFAARGYTAKQETTNLHVDLPARRPAGSLVVRATSHDAERFLLFVEREFGPIWRFEAAKAFERETPPAFMALHDGTITGFSVHDLNNRGLGTFGPTGVAKAMRGRGIGCQLLLASLEDLHASGYSSAIIPWTSALEFYSSCCGAKPAHRFVAFAKPQP